MKPTLIGFAGYARKFLVALAAALAILVVALSDDAVTRLEWVQVAIAFLGAVGVYQIPNKAA